MFKKTPENPQFNLFSTPSTQMGKREAKKYDDPHGWHNLFYANVTSKIDETVFSPLFKEGNMGAPNASIRVIIAMSVIKEGFGCSDEELFEKCRFDLLVRKALGLFSLSDVVPSIDTYYLLRRRICEYENRHGINLMEKSFEQLTGNQLSRFKISGKSVRMDSKLIGSNIARYSRFEIIHNTFRGFIKGLGESGLLLLNPKLRKQVVLFLEEDGGKIVYHCVPLILFLYEKQQNTIQRLTQTFFTFARCLWINHVRLGNYLITTDQRTHENGLIADFRYIKSSILERLFIMIAFLLPRLIKTGNKKSTNLFLKLQIATF